MESLRLCCTGVSMRYWEIIVERVELLTIDSYAVGRGRRVPADNAKKVRLYVNPGKAELERVAAQAERVRFIIGEDDNLYVCDANQATHFDIVHHAGIDEKYAGFIAPGLMLIRRTESIREMAPLLRANTHVLDAMGGAAFRVERNYETMSDF